MRDIDPVALIGLGAIVTLLPRMLGPAVLGRRQLNAAAMAVIDLLAPAMLIGLIVVGIWGGGHDVASRAAGVVVGLAVVLRGGSPVSAIALAVVTTAGLRAL